MEIDMRTLFFIFSAGNIFIILFLSAYIFLYKSKIPIINIFIIAKIFYFFQWSFYALRNIIPDLYSVLVANIFLIFAISYDIYCVAFAKQVFNRNLFKRLNLIPFFLSCIFLTFISSEESIRTIIISFIISAIYMGGGLYLFFVKLKTKIQHLASYLCFVISLLFFMRALWVVFIDSTTQLYSNSYIHLISGISLSLVSFSWAIVLLLILKEQDEEIIKNDNLRLQELNGTKDRLFSIIAHDLRNPFHIIIGFSRILNNADNTNNAKHKETINTIYSTAQNSAVLLENLLNWATLQTGELSLRPEKILLSEDIFEIFDLNKSFAKAKDISLHYLPTNEIELYTDRNILKTVLRNLISNAIKFTHVGGNVNMLTTANQDHVEISIIDNGVGMNEGTIQKLFNISTNATSTGTANEKGSGLGLVLCKEFVEKLDGHIWVESEEGKGSNFKFTLPLSISK